MRPSPALPDQTEQHAHHGRYSEQTQQPYQQSQNDAVVVDNDSNLLGVIESFDLYTAHVEGHEHGNQL